MRVLAALSNRDARARLAAAACAAPRVVFADFASSGREALALLGAWRPDVLLAALPLCDLGALEFVRIARRSLASCQILLVAAPGAEDTLVAALEAGAAGCVLEPCGAPELIAHALALHAGGSPLHPRVARRLIERLHARACAEAARAGLTARESAVVALLADGLGYAQIGDCLGISINTVGSHIKSAYRKLDVHSAAAAVSRALELHDAREAGVASPDHGIERAAPAAQHDLGLSRGKSIDRMADPVA